MTSMFKFTSSPIKVSTKLRATLVAKFALILAAIGLATSAVAQTYPSKPIRLVVPFPPGGLIDSMARLIVPALSQELGQPIVVENKPGAGGNLGPVELAKSPADGYTLLMASPPLTISPALYKTLPYKPADIQPVALFGQLPNVLMVHPEAGINNVADLVAKAKSSPGKLNYASNGNGTSLHLSAELLKSLASVHIVHIAYRGSAMANVAVMSKEVDLMFDNLPPALPHIQSGKLKALAVTTAKRHPLLPNVPTMQEAGFAQYQVSAWFGLAVQRGTPNEVSNRLQEALRKVLAQKELAATIAARGVSVEFMDTNQTTEFMKSDSARWQKVAKYAGITLD
jgi:tripartite-type tricarboxylate transporter receptor subunit TctC